MATGGESLLAGVDVTSDLTIYGAPVQGKYMFFKSQMKYLKVNDAIYCPKRFSESPLPLLLDHVNVSFFKPQNIQKMWD